MRAKVMIVLMILLPGLYIWSCNRNQKKIHSAGFKFPLSLQSLDFYTLKMSDLMPNEGVINYELSSTLFTDYAEKQRLIKLPKGKKMIVRDNGLLGFPEGSMIAKTFFYSDSVKKLKHIIETRVLVLRKGKWFAGTYKWNKLQNQARYTPDSSTVPVTYRDSKGRYLKTGYHIPSAEECQSCHRFADEIVPIGPKAMNMNRMVVAKGRAVNQLALFTSLHLLNTTQGLGKIDALPPYADKSISLQKRARAYLEINCAHCHNPAGTAYQQSVMLGYHVPLAATGIKLKAGILADRMGSMGPYHMPKLGTTVIDQEGVELVRRYLKSKL